jgi:hypothetical protein
MTPRKPEAPASAPRKTVRFDRKAPPATAGGSVGRRPQGLRPAPITCRRFSALPFDFLALSIDKYYNYCNIIFIKGVGDL